MFTKFNEETRKALIQSKNEMKKLKHPYVGSEHLLLALLKNKNYSVTTVLNKFDIDYEKFRKKVIEIIGIGKSENDWYLYTPLLKRVIEEAILLCKESNEEEVTLEHLLWALIEEGEGVALRILICLNVNIDDLSKEIFIGKRVKKNRAKKKLIIEDYGYNMNEKAEANELDPVIGREKEIDRIMEILCRRTKNNPLLIGDAGVGKTAIVEELSRRINEGSVPQKLKNKKIISISMASLIAGTKYRGEFEERINKILSEIEQTPEIILFIDEIHTLVGAGGAEGAIDASNILKPFLARGMLKLIGATTIEEYKKYLEDDHALDRRFQTLIIEEPTKEKTINILKKIKPIYELYHNVTVEDETLKSIVELSNKYMHIRKQPDKAIDILDEACAKTAMQKDKSTSILDEAKRKLKNLNKEKNEAILNQDFLKASSIRKEENVLETKINKIELKKKNINNKKIVTLETIAEVIKSKTKIPIYEVISEDLKELNKIESHLKSKVVGQDNIIKQLSKDIKRIKLGYKNTSKPVSYLFVGPTGVGKTLLAKELNKLLTSEDNIIRLDMSEYKEEHSISKIIGSPPGYVGYSNKDTILDKIKINQNSIILLDEIEKGHPSVINLFLQCLDEGRIKNSNNEEIRLDNNIIIMTSNIGYNKNFVGFNNENKENIIKEVRNVLGMEMINRINQIFVFDKLSEKSIRRIISNEIEKTKQYFGLDNNSISISNEVINQIVDESKYEDFGARRVEMVIKNKIYNIIIDEILKKSKKITIEAI